MKKSISASCVFLLSVAVLYGQNNFVDTVKTVNLGEVVITSNKLPVKLKNNPGSLSLITSGALNNLPKGIGAEEALRFVPGVRIDNQHDGERIHLSVRGQGILTERGIRGIGVLLDGIPVNDPSGFAPDLYDVDWSTIKKIEVMRGASAGLYGSGGAAGVISIFTKDGGTIPFGGELSQTIGSNGFTKSLFQVGGKADRTDYRISYSHNGGDGYRDHQGFRSNKLYEKVNFNPSEKLSLTQIISHTEYFQQNPEGLNMEQFDNLRQANPDANPFNEYQKTSRTTAGIHATYTVSKSQDVGLTAYMRSWDYKETSNKSAEYRTISNPGASLQYNLHLGSDKIKNNLSIGTDLKWQSSVIYKLQSSSDPLRKESIDDTNLETDSLLANQIISQNSMGVFALYKLDIGRFILLGNVRYDDMNNKLTNKLEASGITKTSKDFSKGSVRIGASYDVSEAVTLFANWSQGFMPPSTEELASNPEGFSGFNTHLVPATSESFELGGRGFLGKKFSYEITAFKMNTSNDFFRFKQSGRGNQEVFYGNAGNSKRLGIETYLSWDILENLNLQLAYTFADYKYTSASVDPVYTDEAYVLTSPPAAGQVLPNSPAHQLYSELVYKLSSHFSISAGTEYQSKWAIYTDAKAYNNELDPAIYSNWQDGFNLYNARISYNFRIKELQGECSLFARNLTSAKYMAFTEPDPDGNAYQPGPSRELFVNIRFAF